MPQHDCAEIAGRVTDIFAHRFVIETASGERLSDLGATGVEAFRLVSITEILAEGEMKPLELKVDRIKANGGTPIAIPHKPKPRPDDKHHKHAADAKPDVAVKAMSAAGVGVSHRKPKHFEVLAHSGQAFVEWYGEYDGHVHKNEVVAAHDPKWADDIKASA